MWVQIAIWVITTVIGMLRLRQKPPKPAPTPGISMCRWRNPANPFRCCSAPGHPAGQRGLAATSRPPRFANRPVVRQEMIVTHDDAKAFIAVNAGLRKWFRVTA